MLESDQVCALESEDFPPISVVYAEKPKFPARVYAIHKSRVAIFVCEVPLPKGTHRAVARTLTKWSQAHKCNRIVALEGLPSEQDETAPRSVEPRVWGVGSTDNSRQELRRRGVEILKSGIISGVTGVLLNEGRWQNFDVIALLAEARPNIPDAHAAVALTKKLSNLMPELKVDLSPLEESSSALEEYLQRLKEQAKPVVPEHQVPMYR